MIRLAVASTPGTATLAEAVPAVVAAIEEAGRLGARVVCLPETCLPGHRLQPRPVPNVAEREIEEALDAVAGAAAAAGVAAVVGAERPTPAGRMIVAAVVDGAGTRLGEQAKTQVDVSEEPHYVPGRGRRTFHTAGLTFGIAICHEAFRYPEIARSLALAGARAVFVPHLVADAEGSMPRRFCDPAGSYHEQALMCRALENTVYVVAANAAGPDQRSASCIIAPDGSLVAQVAYGRVGVAAADVDLALADGLLARRWAPERNVLLHVAEPAAVNPSRTG
ncbi:MAG TPA: carbon-nitrogen hydrolase family protein [Gaiellales bacterium]|nr:carbon-nitrogen hydrolase family protein [Gaiellales bacterium]